jgi:hypothetical protein
MSNQPTLQTNARTLELRTPPATRGNVPLESRACESCARRQNILDDASGKVVELCRASQGLTWQEMSRMEPSIGGCGPLKLKFRPR